MNARQPQINPFEDGTARRALRGLPSFEEGLARLLHTAEHGRPFGIVRGPAGVGKSALLEGVAEAYRNGGNECGQIDLRRTTTAEFAWRLACELGAAPASTQPAICWRSSEDTILGRALSSRMTLLLLDHLDAVDAALAKQLERLLTIADASAGWCSVLSAGRTDSPIVDAVTRDHADLRIELAPLDTEETCDLLQQVVELSGCTPFTEEAGRMIAARTGGVLRDVMRLGRLALLAQAAEDAPEVTADIVAMVAGEVAITPSRPRLDSRSTLPTVAAQPLH